MKEKLEVILLFENYHFVIFVTLILYSKSVLSNRNHLEHPYLIILKGQDKASTLGGCSARM
jgi:hypothetical protein